MPAPMSTVDTRPSPKSKRFKQPISLVLTTIRSCTTSISTPIRNCGCHHGVTESTDEIHGNDPYLHTLVGYTTKTPSQYQLQDGGSAQAVDALGAVFGQCFSHQNTRLAETIRLDIVGTKYVHGNIGATIYIASGNTVDWTYGTANVTYSYAVELRDTGRWI